MSEDRGRPTIYTQQLADEICRRLIDNSLRKVCDADDMPHRDTVRDWVINDHKGFSDQYARARRMQALEWAEETIEISDSENQGDTQRARLRVDTRKWLLSKVLPKVYGDKVTLAGDSDAPIAVNVTRTIIHPNADG